MQTQRHCHIDKHKYIVTYANTGKREICTCIIGGESIFVDTTLILRSSSVKVSTPASTAAGESTT